MNYLLKILIKNKNQCLKMKQKLKLLKKDNRLNLTTSKDTIFFLYIYNLRQFKILSKLIHS